MALKYLLLAIVLVVSPCSRAQNAHTGITFMDRIMPGISRAAANAPGHERPSRPRPSRPHIPISFGENFPNWAGISPGVVQPSVGVDLVNRGSESTGSVQPSSDHIELPETMNIDEMPMDSIQRMNSISNMEEFARVFGIDLPEERVSVAAAPGALNSPALSEDTLGTLGIAGRFGGGSSQAVNAEMANCEPELVTVPLDLPSELNVMYFPTCVRLQRCGGCCQVPLLQCQPTHTEPVTLKVMRIEAVSRDAGHSRRSRPGRRRRRQTAQYYQVEEERHTQCQCQCRVQEHHCNPAVHDYFQSECLCRCKNRDEQAKCEARGSTHYWDNETCSCYCTREVQCSTGRFFNHSSCRYTVLSYHGYPKY